MIASIEWSMDPEIIGGFPIRWYGLLFVTGPLIGYYILNKIFKIEGENQKDLDLLALLLIVGVIIGARLGHVLFYNPQDYFSDPIRILNIREGGLASHGAALGILLALGIFKLIRKKFDMLWLFDRLSVVVPISAFFVRVGNFVNSEIVGIPSNLPWAVHFVDAQNAAMADMPRHPAQLYEALAYIILFAVQLVFYFKFRSKLKRGFLSGFMLIFMFTARFFIEIVKVRQEDFYTGLPLDMGQLLSIPFVLLGIGLVFYSIKTKKKLIEEQK